MNCDDCSDRGWNLRDARIQVCDCGVYDPPKWVTRGDTACVIPHAHEVNRPRRAAIGYACAGHRAKIERLIAELPAYYDDLGDALTSSERFGREGKHQGPSTTVGINLNGRIVDARDEVHAELVRIARDVAEGRKINGPSVDEVPAIASWLTTQVDWLCEQPDVDDTHHYLDALTGKCKSLTEPSGRRRFLIPNGICQAALWCDVTTREIHRCDGQLIALLMPDDDRENLSEITCDLCGCEVPLMAAQLVERWKQAS